MHGFAPVPQKSRSLYKLLVDYRFFLPPAILVLELFQLELQKIMIEQRAMAKFVSQAKS